MKKLLIIFLFVSSATCLFLPKANAQDVTVSFQVFYDDLSPYGTWINNPDYGYVWIPNEAPGFSPYATNGYWTYTDYGWTWVSNYPWGWAPFHYGRWYSDPLYGPIWVPDNEWGPGWVDWRNSDGYYGWCAMGPGSYHHRDEDWRFVDNEHFGSTTINNYYVNTTENTTIINKSTIVNNPRTDNSSHVTYNSGPDKTEVETRTKKTVTPIVVKESSTHGQTVSNGQLEIYKPQVQKNNVAGTKPAPAKVADPKEVKTIDQRKVETPTESSKPQTEVKKENPAVGQSQKKTQPVAKPQSTQQPKPQPTSQPKSQPTQQPKQKPTSQPKSQPKQQPTSQPKSKPHLQPKQQPTSQARQQSAPQQHAQPTSQPHSKPH